MIIPGNGATMKRCKYCNEICPDFSDMCDCCTYIELCENPDFIPNEVESEEEDEGF